MSAFYSHSILLNFSVRQYCVAEQCYVPVCYSIAMQLIPDDMEFQSGDVPNYTTSDGSVCFHPISSSYKSSQSYVTTAS